MSTVVYSGKALGRSLIVVTASLSEIAVLDRGSLPSCGFMAIFLLGNVTFENAKLEAALKMVLLAGANSLLFHGERAREAEDIADDLIVRTRSTKETRSNVIVTVSKHDESLEEFLEEATHSILPAADYGLNWCSNVYFCLEGEKQAK